MAELTGPRRAAAAPPMEPPEPVWARLRDGLRAYLLIAGMWTRSALAYRLSFVMMTFGSAAMTGLSFASVLIIFLHTSALGGFTLPQTAFLYGTSGVSLGLADLLLGSMDALGRRVRDGTLDTMMVRPASVYAQVAADRFALRRLGRISQAALVLVWSVDRLDVRWTPVTVALLPVMLLSGAAIFGAVYTIGAAFQFWANDASEVQNSFTYGGNALTQYPPTLFAKDLVRGADVRRTAGLRQLACPRCASWPSPTRSGCPAGSVSCRRWSPLAVCAVAGLAWRAGLRSYRSTGS